MRKTAGAPEQTATARIAEVFDWIAEARRTFARLRQRRRSLLRASAGRRARVKAAREAERLARLEALAQRCEAERSARARLERVLSETRFLAEASSIMARSLDLEATLHAAAQLGVARLSDCCVIDLTHGDGQFERAAAAHADPGDGARTGRYGRLPAAWTRRWSAYALLSGQPVLCVGPGGDRAVGDTPGPLDLAPREALCIPLVATARLRRGGLPWAQKGALDAARQRAVPEDDADRAGDGEPTGGAFGVMSFVVTRAGRRFEPEHIALAQQLARRAAEAIENAMLYAEVQRAVRTREDLLAMVSHDLRNPLGVVTMGAAILGRSAISGADGDHVRRHAQRIARAADGMTQLIRDLLDAATIEAGKLQVDPAEHEIEGLVAEAIDLFGPLAAQRAIRIERSVAVTGVVRCDRSRILQVFSNLVGNAIKFTPKDGEVTIQVARGEGGVRFSVADTGPGIPKDALPHLFERYWRAKPAQQGGAGLGLFIARGIVEAHGAVLVATSEPGAGTTFSFTLPAPPGALAPPRG